MKLTASLFLLLACAGCSTQTASVAPTIPPAQPMTGTSHDSIAPIQPQSLHLTWTENYVAGFTNEQTEIDESTDLVNWATCFTGATNECWIQEIYPFAFYRAKNFLP